MKTCTLLLLVFFPALLVGCVGRREFRSDVERGPTPWTHLAFRNDPADFQFAIIGDFTGGYREGVFERAAPLLNLLQPEFAISIGDLLEGYTLYPDKLAKDWAALEERIALLEMPFFYVIGNHDLSNALMAHEWDRRMGRRNYWFVYKNVLFVCLDTLRGYRFRNGMDDAQVDWLRHVLAKHTDVRWTMVFMHHPLWFYEEAKARKLRARHEPEADAPSFARMQALLADRAYTLFSGHHHAYRRYAREGRDYFWVATTGGHSTMTGAHEGRYDGFIWVTMTDDGPRFINLDMVGLHDMEVCTETRDQTAQATMAGLNALTVQQPRGDTNLPDMVTTAFTNLWTGPITARIEWTIPEECPWTVHPATNEFTMAPGERREFVWALDCTGSWTNRESLAPAPRARIEIDCDDPLLSVSRGLGLYIDRWPYGEMLGAFRRNLWAAPVEIDAVPFATNITMWPYNPLDEPMQVVLNWITTNCAGWTVEPASAAFALAPDTEQRLDFQVSFDGTDDTILPIPFMTAQFCSAQGESFSNEVRLAVDADMVLAENVPTVACRRAAVAPVIDGVLDDASWQCEPGAVDFLCQGWLRLPEGTTHAWLAYDEQALYFAFRCAETNLDDLTTVGTERDRVGRGDDRIALYLNARRDGETYYRFEITASNVVADAKHFSRDWTGEFDSATGREDEAWTLEIAFPWKTLDSHPLSPGARMGLEMTRIRSNPRETSSWAPMPRGWGGVDYDLLGMVRFE